MRFDVVVVGGGTAGCVLAARLSENPDRRVCLLEAGPDFGPLEDGRWPAEILDARRMPFDHTWTSAPDDGERTLGGRLLGGSSAVNACVILEGSPADYDEWGVEWSAARLRPFLELAKATLRTAPTNHENPGPFHRAFVESAVATGFPLLSDPNAPEQPVGVGPYPANVADGVRWNAALAYLDPARGRPNLDVVGDVLVVRVLFDGTQAAGVIAADGRAFAADAVILSAGAYFSPAILMRSGIGPERDLVRLEIPVVCPLPVGEQLLDHHGARVEWTTTSRLDAETAEHARENGGLHGHHAIVKAASRHCVPGAWDLHVIAFVTDGERTGSVDAAALVFHMKPRSSGRVTLRSADPSAPPVVERGLLSHPEDVETLVDGIGIARRIARADPLAGLLGRELRPGDSDPADHVRATVGTYFHPAGTCPLGRVVDVHGRVFGTEGLYVVDASAMPTIPRANTNLTTAALAELVAAGFA